MGAPSSQATDAIPSAATQPTAEATKPTTAGRRAAKPDRGVRRGPWAEGQNPSRVANFARFNLGQNGYGRMCVCA
eukprot:6056452-Alexandrium_andersonii.AAC.1